MKQKKVGLLNFHHILDFKIFLIKNFMNAKEFLNHLKKVNNPELIGLQLTQQEIDKNDYLYNLIIDIAKSYYKNIEIKKDQNFIFSLIIEIKILYYKELFNYLILNKQPNIKKIEKDLIKLEFYYFDLKFENKNKRDNDEKVDENNNNKKKKFFN